MRRCCWAWGVAVWAGVAAAQADIVSVVPGSAALELGPTADLRHDQSQSFKLQYLNEQQGVLLGSDLDVDLDSAFVSTTLGGFWTAGISPTVGTTLAAGTRVSSHLLHIDPFDIIGTGILATIEFDAPILGFYVTTSGLNDTDALLGLDTVTYPSVARRPEIPDTIYFDLLSPTEMSIGILAKPKMDQIRVVTAYIPEPGAVLLGLLGLTGAASLRRR